MVVTPDSKIILLKSPLKLDNLNQITFTSLLPVAFSFHIR